MVEPGGHGSALAKIPAQKDDTQFEGVALNGSEQLMAVVGASVIYQYKFKGSSSGTHDFKGIFYKGLEIRGLVINRDNYGNFRG
jgi:hypothetical protein